MEDHVGHEDRHFESIDDLDALLGALPPEIVAAVHALPEPTHLIEVVLDLGRRPEARFRIRRSRFSIGRSTRPTSRSSSSTSGRSATTTGRASSGRSIASAPSATATARSSG
jgi:hypothetical protein